MNFYLKTFILIFFINIGMVFPQGGQARFDSIFYDTAVRKSATDILMASQIADSLFKASSTNLQKIKSLMLSADLHEKQSKREEAIAYVLQAESIANTIENHEWQARIYGFLSTQYRIIGLIDQGKRYLDKGLKICDKITPQSSSDQYRGMVFQEMAHYAIYEKKYEEAVGLLEKANLYFSHMNNPQMKQFFFGNNEEMLGRSYLKIGDYKAAEKHYHKSITHLKEANAGNSQWAGMVFHGLGKIALENSDSEKALSYLNKADTIAQAVDHTALKVLVYADLAKYYQIAGDLQKYAHYNSEHLKNLNKNTASARLATNKAINQIYEDQQADFSILQRFVILLGSLFLMSFGLYYMTRNKRRKEKNIMKLSFSEINTPKIATSTLNTSLSIKEDRLMPEETEQGLLHKLEQFEINREFTNPDLRLSVLAADFKTNTKYLSYIINTHKKMDFNNYINDLRILYIIETIQNNPSYLNYKISYLSQECGFSSHSKFATIFKNNTGLTPSAFLNQVKAAHEGQRRND